MIYKSIIKTSIFGWVNTMVVKDVKAMITYSFSYADEIGWKKNGIYPQDAGITLRNQLKDDLLVFLGYIYDDNSSSLSAQVAFINDSLQITITPENFLRFRNEKCLAPDILERVPLSLQYFIKDDISPFTRRAGYGIALSKYLINTFNDVGCYFAAFSGVSDYEAERISTYINMMNNYLDGFGLLEHTPVEVRAAMGIVDKPERVRPSSMTSTYSGSFGSDERRYNSRYSGRNIGGSLLGTLFGASNYAASRRVHEAEYDKPYTTSQAELDAMIMMENYNKKYAGTGAGFDNKMLYDTPTGNVDRSMAIDSADGMKVAEPGKVDGTSKALGESETRKEEESLEDLMAQLDSLIGLQSVKKNLNNLINIVKVSKLREEMGLKTPEMSHHLVFSGNPGTGKTTVARLLAKIYHQLGVVSKGQLVEVDRAGLVEGYVGQTAQKTSKVCDEAMGGVLFIDEAYTLTSAEGQDFGQEAVDTILKRMEDNRGDFVVIVAGYTEQMEDFIDSNPGLKSRFNKFIEFPDYTGEELRKIYDLMCYSQDYVLNGEAGEYVKRHLEEMSHSDEENFANAREVRNYFERCVERQASRIVKSDNIDANALTTFKLEDVQE